MGHYHNPQVISNGMIDLIDITNPRCFNGSSATLNDLINGKVATGNSLSSIVPGVGISFGTNANTYVSLGSSFVESASTQYTRLCWFNLADVTTPQPLIASPSPRGAMWLNSTTKLSMFHSGTRLGVAPTLSSLAGTTDLSPNVWYFGAVTYKSSIIAAVGETGGRIYLNGILDNSSTSLPSIGANAGAARSHHLGRYLDPLFTPSRPILNGTIAYAAVYDRVLSAEEILKIYNATKKRFGH